jgi:hypothetical protein
MTPFWAGFSKRAGVLGTAGTVLGKVVGSLGAIGTGADMLGAAAKGAKAGTENKGLYYNMARAARPMQTF